jgi:lysophospholipase L1-like esterase
LDQPGVGTVIVYSGINDLIAPQSGSPADAVIDSYLAMIGEAHRAGVRILGATLTPAGRSGAVEAERQEVNRWIRTSGAFDGVIDFDVAIRNPSDASHIIPGLTTDSLHLDDAGYQLLADAVDVTLFPSTVTPTSCAP